jgi:hypothetical protein
MTTTHIQEREPDPQAGLGPGYETRDASVPGLLTFGVGLIVFGVVLQLLMLGIYRLFVNERPDAVKEVATDNLYQQLRTLHHDEDQALGGYGWVDRKEGIVRIPIDRAIDLVAEKGIRFGRGPRTELEMASHGGSPVPDAAADAKKPAEEAGSKK